MLLVSEGALVFGGFVIFFMLHSVQSGSLIYDPITYLLKSIP